MSTILPRAQKLVTTTTVYPIGSGNNNADNKILNGKGAMPGHFYPTASGNAFSMNRQAYMRTALIGPKDNSPQAGRSLGNGVSAGKPLNITDSSSRTMMLRFNAVGKSSVNNTNTTPTAPLAFAGIDRNVVKSSLIRVRRVGAAAPPKKGLVRR